MLYSNIIFSYLSNITFSPSHVNKASSHLLSASMTYGTEADDNREDVFLMDLNLALQVLLSIKEDCEDSPEHPFRFSDSVRKMQVQMCNPCGCLNSREEGERGRKEGTYGEQMLTQEIETLKRTIKEVCIPLLNKYVYHS